MPYSNIRMIVMDMDDTLLDNDLKISPQNQAAIAEAQRAGITIVLASGRPTPAMAPYADLLNFQQGGFVISYNGAYVDDWANYETLFEVCLSKYEVDLLTRTARAQGVNLHTYIDGEIITESANPHTDYEAELTGMPVKVVKDLIMYSEGPVPKVLLVAEPDKVRQMKDNLTRALGGRFMISISKPVFLEFTNQNVDKSKGIDVLCAKLGIDKADVMAIGDSYNDLTMLRDCGVGVAMGNASDDIKAIADVTTDTCLNNGVAKIIREVIESQSSSTVA